MQLTAALVLKLGAVNAFTAAAGAGGVAALNHKILDDAVKNQSVVVALFRQRHKVLHRFGGNLGIKLNGDIAHVGMHNGTGTAALGKLLQNHNLLFSFLFSGLPQPMGGARRALRRSRSRRSQTAEAARRRLALRAPTHVGGWPTLFLCLIIPHLRRRIQVAVDFTLVFA